MLTINLPLGLVVLAGAPIVGLVYKAMARGRQERSLELREDNSALLSVAAENYTAIPVVKMFGLGGRESKRFGRASERLFRAQRRLSLFGGLFGLSVNMIVDAAAARRARLRAWLILEGRFTIGGLVAFLAIMGEVINPVTVLTSIGQDIQAATGALVRINEVLDADPEPGRRRGRAAPTRTELRLSDLSFSYTTERRALDGIDAVIPAGANVAFVGPSGSGKSTVLRLIMRMYEPEEGSISARRRRRRDGTVESLREADRRRLPGPVPVQHDDPREHRARQTGRHRGGDPRRGRSGRDRPVHRRMPHGYDTLVGERGSNLSGGQRQRVSIARALIRDPRILLLDEATSALDPGTERQISATLRKVGADRTVVAITHRLTSITDYDAIFVIDGGRLVEYGTTTSWSHSAARTATCGPSRPAPSGSRLAPFDAAGALGRTALFRSLDRPALDEIARRLRSFVLQPGDEIGDESGGLVSSGRAAAKSSRPSFGAPSSPANSGPATRSA